MAVFSTKKKNRAITATKALLALLVFAIVIIVVVLTTSRLFNYQFELSQASEQFRMFEETKSRMSKILESAFFIPTRSSSTTGIALKAFGISSLQTKSLASILLVYAPPEAAPITTYQATLSSDKPNDLQLAKDGISVRLFPANSARPHDQPFQLLYLASKKSGQVVSLLSFDGKVYTTGEPIAASLHDGSLVTAQTATPYLFFVEHTTMADNLKLLKKEIVADAAVGEVLLSNIKTFDVLYALQSRRTVDADDHCQPPSNEFIAQTSTTWPGNCTVQNLAKVKITLGYRSVENSSAPTGFFEQESFQVTPSHFALLNAHHQNDFVAESFDSDCNPADPLLRCLPQCKGRYGSALYETESNYCRCMEGSGGIAHPTMSALLAGAKAKDTWAACCNYASEAFSTDTTQFCSQSLCTAAPFEDNPHLLSCHPELCSKMEPQNSCLWSVCEKNSSLPSSIEKLPSSSGPPPVTNNAGIIPQSGGKYLNWHDSEACGCYRELYGSSTPITLKVDTATGKIGTYRYHYDDASEVSYTFPVLPKTPDGQMPVTEPPILTASSGNIKNILTCYDPRFYSSIGRTHDRDVPDVCTFDGKPTKEEAFSTAPWDQIGAEGKWQFGGLPGVRKEAGSQMWMIECACEISGFPEGLPDLYLGFDATSSPDWASVPSGKCSCLWPERAAHSKINAGKTVEQIRASCGLPPRLTGGGF